MPNAEELKPVVDVFVARYNGLPAVHRVLLAMVLPHAKLAPVMAPFDQAVRSDNALARPGRCGEPCLPVRTIVAHPSRPVTRRPPPLAGTRPRAPHGGQGPGYSRLTPGDFGARPPTPSPPLCGGAPAGAAGAGR